jgi:hypothetical protein
VSKRAKWSKTSFGYALDYPMPDGCDVIVLGVMKFQIEPIRVLLPHQIYRDDLKKLMAEHQTDEIFIIPYRSADILSFKRSELFHARQTESVAV